MSQLSLFGVRIIYFVITRALERGMVDKVKSLIMAAFGNKGMTGIEKRALVEQQIMILSDTTSKIFAETSGFAMDILFAAIVGKYKLENPEEFK